MKKYKFTLNIWLVFDYRNHTAIGRTIIKNGIEAVSFILESGETGIIKYENIINPRKLKLVNFTLKNLDYRLN